MLAFAFKFTCLTILFLLFYRMVLRDQKMLVFNRGFLIISLLASVIIPRIDILYTTSYDVIPIPIEQFVSIESPILQEEAGIDYHALLTSIYLVVLCLMMIRFLSHLYQLYKKHSVSTKSNHQGATLVLTEQEALPFAFMNLIFINRSAYHSGEIDDRILTHELAHSRQGHSWDIIIIELLRVIFWFNPILWFYKNDIRLNHEFLADQTVLAFEDNTKAYQYLLLRLARPSLQAPSILTNSINYFVTKKRLEMMFKTTQLRDLRLRISLSFVFAIAMVFTFHQRSYAQGTGASPEEMKEYESIVKRSWSRDGELITIRLIDANRMHEISSKFNSEQAEKFERFDIPPPPAPPAPAVMPPAPPAPTVMPPAPPVPAVMPPAPPAPPPPTPPSVPHVHATAPHLSHVQVINEESTVHPVAATAVVAPLPVAPPAPPATDIEENDYDKFILNGEEVDYASMKKAINSARSVSIQSDDSGTLKVITKGKKIKKKHKAKPKSIKQ